MKTLEDGNRKVINSVLGRFSSSKGPQQLDVNSKSVLL